MNQRELARELEAFFKDQQSQFLAQRRQVHEERVSQSDEEWWQELVERTTAIRPQMLEVFERNKAEMISKRLKTIDSERDFQEKEIRRQVTAVLPHLSALRSEREIIGPVTTEQIAIAINRSEAPISTKN